METEWSVLRERGVFELVDAPPDMHIIDCGFMPTSIMLTETSSDTKLDWLHRAIPRSQVSTMTRPMPLLGTWSLFAW